MLERQFGWGGNLQKSNGGEYKICFIFNIENEEWSKQVWLNYKQVI